MFSCQSFYLFVGVHSIYEHSSMAAMDTWNEVIVFLVNIEKDMLNRPKATKQDDPEFYYGIGIFLSWWAI